MEPTFTVLGSHSGFLQRYATQTGRTFQETLLRAARGTVKYALRITPPFNADGGPDAPTGDAFNRGKRAITRDLDRHFRRVRTRGIGVGAQDPYKIYRRLITANRKKFGRPLQRDQAAPYFVDATQTGRLEKLLHSKVGKLAAGWLPAARTLGTTGTPAWIARHGGEGRGYAKINGSLFSHREMSVEIVNNVGRHVPTGELQRRINKAQVYQQRAMQRELDHLLKKAPPLIAA